jgi:hypothetical protein
MSSSAYAAALVRSDDAKNAFVPCEEQREELHALVRGRNRMDIGSPLRNVAKPLWTEDLTRCHAHLMQLWRVGLLTCSPQRVVMSYAHMLNNRLGISFREELHLYGLLARAFAETAGVPR